MWTKNFEFWRNGYRNIHSEMGKSTNNSFVLTISSKLRVEVSYQCCDSSHRSSEYIVLSKLKEALHDSLGIRTWKWNFLNGSQWGKSVLFPSSLCRERSRIRTSGAKRTLARLALVAMSGIEMSSLEKSHNLRENALFCQKKPNCELY
jgi:hypothetical protein